MHTINQTNLPIAFSPDPLLRLLGRSMLLSISDLEKCRGNQQTEDHEAKYSVGKEMGKCFPFWDTYLPQRDSLGAFRDDCQARPISS